MKLKDYQLEQGNHFVAMEYYALMMNRTFLILITDEYLIGLKTNGLISAEGGRDPLTRTITKSMSIQNNLSNPYSYMNGKYLRELENLNIFEDKILKISNSNFRIKRQDIKTVLYDKSKKWGMAHYPHDGKVYVKIRSGKSKELIILGSQSGSDIQEWIKGS
ncbi:MAG: hypothetical protein AB8F78_10785 [Saprospiraceae bacterium]